LSKLSGESRRHASGIETREQRASLPVHLSGFKDALSPAAGLFAVAGNVEIDIMFHAQEVGINFGGTGSAARIEDLF